jgi:hypothetical protein
MDARSLVLALVLGLPAPAVADRLAAPRAITLDLPGGPGVNPSRAEQRRSLFIRDRWNRALACPRARAARQPTTPDRHRCAWTPTAALRLGRGVVLWAGVSPYASEWDGMYSHHEDLVLLRPGVTPKLVCTLTQWRQSVTDCSTDLLVRRLALRDLDGDGVAELCLETITETGAGLFEVMDLGRRRWVPTRRYRGITAWRLDRRRSRLVWKPELAAGCPRTGYALPVRTRPLEDAVAARRQVQGGDRGRRPTPRRPDALGYGCP